MPHAETKTPLITLISVTLNNISGLQKTQKSILNQTFKGYKWLVVDGASDDGTAQWLTQINTRHICEPDQGLYDAMNKGIESAKGQYLIFLNAGDTLPAADTLERISNAIEQHHEPDFLYGDCYEEIEGARPIYKTARNHKKISLGMITHHQAMIYKRHALGDMRYNLNYKLAADYDFTARFLRRIGAAYYCNFPLCVFEAGGLSQVNASAARTEENEIRAALNLCSPLQRRMITIRQAAAQTLKTRAPQIYRALKRT